MDSEETIDNSEEEETPDIKPQEEDSDESEDSEEASNTTPSEEGVSKKDYDKLYARMKAAEETAKTLKSAKKEGTPQPDSDVFNIAKAVASLRDFNKEELDFIQMMSKSKGITPSEAAETEEAKTYIAARRQKVEDEKSKLKPSTKQSPVEKSVGDVTPEDLRKMSVEDKEKFLKKVGW